MTNEPCAICVKRRQDGRLDHEPRPGEHLWGGIPFCCAHFDELVMAMFDIHEAVGQQRHEEFIRLFRNRTGGPPQGPCSGGSGGDR